MTDTTRAGLGKDDVPRRAPLRHRMWVIVLIALPMIGALLFLLLALATGKALYLAVGWIVLQLAGYSLVVSRHWLFPI